MVDYSNIPRDSRRVPLENRIHLKFDRFSGFINEYVANISPGGIFIKTDSPKSAGQVMEFEFRLGDGFELIKGRGEVMWARLVDENPVRPAGMGIRFLELSPGSRDLIYKIVDDFVRRGGTPFDLAAVPEEASTTQMAATTPIPMAGRTAVPEPPRPAQEPPRPAPEPRRFTPPPPTGPAPQDSLLAPSPILEPAPAPTPASTKTPPSVPALAPIPTSAVPTPEPWPVFTDRTAPTLTLPVQALTATPEPDPLQQMATSLPPLEDLAPLPEVPVEAPPVFAGLQPTHSERQVRILPLALLTLALLGLLGAGYWFREYLLDLVGLGDAPTVAQVPAPPQPVHKRGAPSAAAAANVPAAAPISVVQNPVSSPPPTPAAPPTTIPPATSAAAPQSVPTAAVPTVPTPRAARPGQPSSPTPTPLPQPVEARPSTPLTALEKVTWERSAAGTELVLWGNGTFRKESYSHSRLGGEPPREVILIKGVDRSFKLQVPVGTSEVRQIRTGLHQEKGGSVLHVVLDLADPAVVVTKIEEGDHVLRIHLGVK